MTLEELELVVKDLTDKVGSVLDRVVTKDMRLVFRCGASGLYFPDNYVKEWGKLYGIGLGPHPVSETLQSDYDAAPPEITPAIRDLAQIMHPVYVSFAQVDWDMVAAPAALAKSAILAKDDPNMDRRAAIVRQKQAVNPASRTKMLEMKWLQLRGG